MNKLEHTSNKLLGKADMLLRSLLLSRMVYVNITEFIAELKINWINTLYVWEKITLASLERPSPNCITLQNIFFCFEARRSKRSAAENYKRSCNIIQLVFFLLESDLYAIFRHPLQHFTYCSYMDWVAIKSIGSSQVTLAFILA